MGLRKMIESDLPMVLEWRNSDEVRKYMYRNHIISTDEHVKWFRENDYKEEIQLYIYEDEKSIPAGFISFSKINLAQRSAFWGFYKSPKAGKGTGKNLGIEALNHFFLNQAMLSLTGEALITNSASIQFHQKLGFKKVTASPQKRYIGSDYVDIFEFNLNSKTWENHRKQLVL